MTAAKNAVYWVITGKLLLSGREIDLWWEGNKNLVCMGGIFLVGGGGDEQIYSWWGDSPLSSSREN